MAINFNKQNRLFQLDTDHTSYVIGIVDEEITGRAQSRLAPKQDILPYL